MNDLKQKNPARFTERGLNFLVGADSRPLLRDQVLRRRKARSAAPPKPAKASGAGSGTNPRRLCHFVSKDFGKSIMP